MNLIDQIKEVKRVIKSHHDNSICPTVAEISKLFPDANKYIGAMYSLGQVDIEEDRIVYLSE